jgi:hypothetical protein
MAEWKPDRDPARGCEVYDIATTLIAATKIDTGWDKAPGHSAAEPARGPLQSAPIGD